MPKYYSTSAIAINLAQMHREDKDYADQIFKADGVTPQDITGWQITFVVHAYGDPSTVFITKSTGGNGIAITNAPKGVATIQVREADTIGMYPGEFEYCITRVDPGNRVVVTRGLFTLLAI